MSDAQTVFNALKDKDLMAASSAFNDAIMTKINVKIADFKKEVAKQTFNNKPNDAA